MSRIICRWLRSAAGITVLQQGDNDVVFSAEHPDAAQRVLQDAVARGPVARFAPQEPSLAQIFREVIQ